MVKEEKSAYICGPLTELGPDIAQVARDIYVSIADSIEQMFDVRAFVPHEHFDPLNSNASAQEVYRTESERIKFKTSFLVVVAIEPSWGGGGEIQLANEYKVPIFICKPRNKKISKYILGMDLVKVVIEYDSKDDLLYQLGIILENSSL